MIPRSRFQGPRVTAGGLLACICLLVAAVRANAASQADSITIRTTPGKLIVSPPVPPPSETARAGTGPSTGVGDAASDTAAAGRIRRGREAFGRGLLFEEQKAYSAAIISYMNAAKADLKLRGPSYRIGLLYMSRQQWGPASMAFREELRRDPDSREAGMEYALALCETGDTTRAIRRLEALTRRWPADARIWRGLGFAYARASRFEAAEKALRGSVALDAKDPRAWRDLGVVLAARSRDGEARAAYRRALELEPGDETALINLANLESRSGDHERSLAHYREAELRDSLQANAYRGQIRELVWLAREADAGAVWRRWLARAKLDPEVREGTARHYVRQGRTDVALQVARDGVRETPSAAEAWWLLAEMLAQAGDARGALSAYRDSDRRAKDPAVRARVEQGISALRVVAPDSLRALFAADSVAAAADTTRASPQGRR